MTKILISLLAMVAAYGLDLGSTLDTHGAQQVHFGAQSPNYARNAPEAFAPASNSKMFTALSVLEAMGGESTIPTVAQWSLAADGGATDMQVLGYGDPSWGLKELGETSSTRAEALAKLIVGAGVREIHGDLNVVAADARFANLRYPEGWTATDPITCDGALGQAFNMNLNCGTFRVTSPTTGAWLPRGLSEPVTLRLSEGAKTNLLVGLLDPAHPGLGFLVKGTLKKGASYTFSLPTVNSALWVKNLLILALKKLGVQFCAAAPAAGAQARVTLPSPKLKLIVKAMMKNSINLIGDALLRVLASNYGGPGADLLTAGQTYLRQYMLKIGVPDEFQLFDGAGLSRQSRISPRALYAFLNYARTSREFSGFYAALPIAGVDGTLRNRMKGTAAYNRLHAKTGTLDGVYNLSGFVPSASGYTPFVLLSRTSVAQAANARAAEDRFGALLASGLKRALEPAVEAPFPYVPEHAGADDQ